MVVKIIILKDEKPIDQIVMAKDVLTVGRKSECDIVIKDPAVSGHHARIQRVADKIVVQDNGSTNGLHVRGKRVQQYVVRNNDVVVIGEHSLRFVISDEAAGRPGTVRTAPPVPAQKPKAAAAPAPEALARAKAQARQKREPAEKPVAGSAGAAPRRAAPVKAPVGQKAGVRATSALVVDEDGTPGTRIPLVEPLTTIGEPGVQVAAVSRRPQGHFIIHVDGGGDKNRVPLVNGEAIGFKSRKLESGDLVEVAGVRMRYEG